MYNVVENTTSSACIQLNQQIETSDCLIYIANCDYSASLRSAGEVTLYPMDTFRESVSWVLRPQPQRVIIKRGYPHLFGTVLASIRRWKKKIVPRRNMKMVDIKIETHADGSFDDLSRSTLNLVAKSMAARIKDNLQHKVCKNHPEYKHSITIKTDAVNYINVEHSNFCCTDFETEIKKNI